MISKKMQDAINKQINAELYSSYLYLSMSAYFESINLDGFANWMRVQVQEEIVHAMKFFDFVNQRGGRVKVLPIDGPETQWKSPLAAYQHTLKHEEKVTSLINGLMKIAREENDNASIIFLEWFVTEQVEEEKSADEIIKKLQLVGDNGHAILMLNAEAAARVFVPPTPAGEPGAAA